MISCIPPTILQLSSVDCLLARSTDANEEIEDKKKETHTTITITKMLLFGEENNATRETEKVPLYHIVMEN